MTCPRPYHHGDLPRAILAAALDVIAADGPSTLSLRDLARRVGVSHAAPAHHFRDRAGLLTAIATEGYTMLARTLADSRDLYDLQARYVHFAASHTAYFRVMFRPELLRTDDPALVAAKEHAARHLHDSVAAQGAADPALAVMAAWSLAHGYATLLVTGNLDDMLDGQNPQDVFRATATQHPAPPAPPPSP